MKNLTITDETCDVCNMKIRRENAYEIVVKATRVDYA